jgi:8-oxo-dGTP diphosphatase
MELTMISKLNTMNQKVFGEKLDGETYVVREGVYGVVLNDEDKIAVVKNPFGYFLPGGGIEEGENFEECLIREFREETGYSIHINNFIGKSSKYYFSEGFNHYRHPIGFFYLVNLEQRLTDLTEKDHELLWMSQNECTEFLYDHQDWAVKEALRFMLKA